MHYLWSITEHYKNIIVTFNLHEQIQQYSHGPIIISVTVTFSCAFYIVFTDVSISVLSVWVVRFSTLILYMYVHYVKYVCMYLFIFYQQTKLVIWYQYFYLRIDPPTSV